MVQPRPLGNIQVIKIVANITQHTLKVETNAALPFAKRKKSVSIYLKNILTIFLSLKSEDAKNNDNFKTFFHFFNQLGREEISKEEYNSSFKIQDKSTF